MTSVTIGNLLFHYVFGITYTEKPLEEGVWQVNKTRKLKKTLYIKDEFKKARRSAKGGWEQHWDWLLTFPSFIALRQSRQPHGIVKITDLPLHNYGLFPVPITGYALCNKSVNTLATFSIDGTLRSLPVDWVDGQLQHGIYGMASGENTRRTIDKELAIICKALIYRSKMQGYRAG